MQLSKIFALLLFAISSSVFAAPAEWEPVSVRAFAEHLYAEGDYLRAAGEFERYLAFTEKTNPPDRDSVLLETGFCYLGAGDYSNSVNFLNKAAASRDPSLAEEARLNIAFVHFRSGDYRKSIDALQGDESARANLLRTSDYLHLEEWAQSEQTVNRVEGRDTLLPYFHPLRAASEAGVNLSPKSPFLAGALSAVIPGTGKMYAGRIKDGFFSLAVVGLTGALAYNGFHHDGLKSVEGWLLGSLSLGFYGGNVYGSVVAAHQYNLLQKTRILDDLSFSANARIPF